MLPSWNDGAAKSAIVDFVARVTNESGKGYVPPEARVATFDNDGTLWCERLTPLEKRYLRAMAALGPGPHRSGDIADELHRSVTSLGPTRSQLIAKGMVWSPSHGDTAFTVPLFDEYMKRIMPGEDWRTV